MKLYILCMIITFSPAVNNAYTLDGWKTEFNGTMVFDVDQDTDRPNGTFKNCLRADVTTADAAMASSDYTLIEQFIEGQDIIHLGMGSSVAVSMTLSFWVKSTKTGTFCVAFLNNAANRNYVDEYTISSSDTWEHKSITLSNDTSGTWLTTNGIGIRFYFVLALGSDFHTTKQQWQSGTDFGTSNQVNAMDSTDNYFRLTGVQLEVGKSYTDFEHRPYSEKLDIAQRYFEEQTAYSINGVRWIGFQTKKRATPTVSVNQGSAGNITVDGFELTYTASSAISITAASQL